jgi:hypothetical protein
VSARVPRVPLEDVAVGSKVRVWRWDREGDEGIAGVVTFQGKRHWRDAQSITGLDDDDVGFIHGRWLAEVIDAPAPQQPRGEEVDPRDAEIGRLRDALWKYGQHLYACTSSSCRCGLADALKEQP